MSLCHFFTDIGAEKITSFLSTFTSTESELTRGFADFGLDDDNDARSRTKTLKYMQQLVRVLPSLLAFSLTFWSATSRQPRTADACNWLRGHLWGIQLLLLSCYTTTHSPAQHEKTVAELVTRIRHNARRYIMLFSEVVDKIMPTPTKDISEHDEVIDVILHQRRERNDQMDVLQEGFPSHLLRR